MGDTEHRAKQSRYRDETRVDSRDYPAATGRRNPMVLFWTQGLTRAPT